MGSGSPFISKASSVPESTGFFTATAGLKTASGVLKSAGVTERTIMSFVAVSAPRVERTPAIAPRERKKSRRETFVEIVIVREPEAYLARHRGSRWCERFLDCPSRE